MNNGNEALDRRNEMEIRHDKYLMLRAKWSGWHVTPTSLGINDFFSKSPLGKTNARNQHMIDQLD